MKVPGFSITDAGVLMVAGACLIASYAWFWSATGGRGERASIWVAGKQLREVSLSSPQTLQVDGPLGTSTIQVRDGRVRVVDSPGRQKLCVRAGWMSRSGESVICLPNQVVVRVDGGRPRFDSMNF